MGTEVWIGIGTSLGIIVSLITVWAFVARQIKSIEMHLESKAQERYEKHKKDHREMNRKLSRQNKMSFMAAKCGVASLEAHVENGANGNVNSTLKEFKDYFFTPNDEDVTD